MVLFQSFAGTSLQLNFDVHDQADEPPEQTLSEWFETSVQK